MKKPEEVEELCRKLKPIIGNHAEQLWHMYLTEDLTGREELEIDIDLLAEKHLKTESLKDSEIQLTPSHSKEGKFLVGQILFNNLPQGTIRLTEEDFIKQIGIFAITGEGKTNLAYLMALQLLKSGIPFLVIDWKRSWRNLLSLKHKVPELEKVHVFTVGRDICPFLWNPFRQPPGTNRELWVSSVSESLERSHLSGPGVAYYFNRIYHKLFKGLDGDFYPNFFDGKRDLEKVRAYERELKWKQTALRIFQSFTIGCSAKSFNARNPLKLELLLDKPVIIELDLELPKPLRIFLSEIILRWIHLYRLKQGETSKLKHVLFLEEVHNLFSETTWHKDSNHLESVYREVRGFGQGIVSITQHPSLLPIYLLGNCHTQVYLGLQHADDIAMARKSLYLKRDQEECLSKLRVGECILKVRGKIEPCHVRIPLVPGITSVSDSWLKKNTPSYLSLNSVDSSDRNKGYLHSDIYSNGKSSKYPGNGLSYVKRLLIDIHLNLFSSVTERYRRLGLNPRHGNKYRKQLVSENLIKPQNIVTSKGKKVIFDITPKGRLLLRDLGHEIDDKPEGVIHKYWKQKIAEDYRQKGYEVLVEEKINGRPDIIAKKNNKKIAIEIETGKSYALRNIQRDIEAGFDEVICMVTDKKLEERIELGINSIKSKKTIKSFLVKE